MAWFVLVVSGVLETVWASALAQSRGLSRPLPAVLFGVAVVLSMLGLGVALRSIPVGTGYAVWVGIGAVGTAGLRDGGARRAGHRRAGDLPGADRRAVCRAQGAALTRSWGRRRVSPP